MIKKTQISIWKHVVPITIFVFFFQSVCMGNKEGVGLCFFGTPASGKGYFLKQIKQRINNFKKIEPALKEKNEEKADLTLDIIRKQIQQLPGLMQINLVIRTFDWLKELKKVYPKLYTPWWNEFVPKQFNLWANAIQKINNVTFKINENTETLALGVGKKNFKNQNEFLTALENKFGPKLNEIQTNLKWENGQDASYHAFMSLNRFIQYATLFHCFHTKKPIYFDEVGANFEQTKDRLHNMHENNYIVIVYIIHLTHIGINFMQNVYRIITGTDDARDSGSSIVWSYGKLENEGIKAYENITENTEEKKIFIVTQEEELFKRDILDAIAQASTKDDKPNNDKSIDILIKISTESLKDSFDRIQKDLNKLFINNQQSLYSETSIKIPGDKTENIYKTAFDILLQLQLTLYMDHATNWHLSYVPKRKISKEQEKLTNKAEEVRKITGYPQENYNTDYFSKKIIDFVQQANDIVSEITTHDLGKKFGKDSFKYTVTNNIYNITTRLTENFIKLVDTVIPQTRRSQAKKSVFIKTNSLISICKNLLGKT